MRSRLCIVIVWLCVWFELKANDTKSLCQLIRAKIQNINQGYWWNIDLVHMIIKTKGKIENKTYFDLAPTRVAIDN